MEVHHKPHPWHGVREFLKEYAIIVVGVLTALAAEQVVEWFRAQEAVAALRDGVRRELSLNRAHWEANRAQDACVSRRLDAILAWAAAAPPEAVVSNAEIPRLWNLHASAWDTAKANPAVTHLPIAEHTVYSELYDGLAGQQRDLIDEHRGWVDIKALLEQGDSAEDKRALRNEVIVVKDALWRRRANYPGIFPRFDTLHIPADAPPFGARNTVNLLCAPLVTAPARSGRENR